MPLTPTLSNRCSSAPSLAAGLLLLTTLLLAQESGPRTEFYRDEEAFKRGIKLFPFEIHDDDYLNVAYDDLGFVGRLEWYSREDQILKTRTYAYWPDDNSVKRMLEFTPDSLILRELLFGDEPRSRELIAFIYGVDFVSDFRDRFTEVIYDTIQIAVAYKIMSTQGNLIGAIFLDYDSLGYLVGETWFRGDDPQGPLRGMQRVREFQYVFHRDTGEQEVIERGGEGQVISHVRIQDPHRVTAGELNLDIVEQADSLQVDPQEATPGGGGEPDAP